MTKVWRRYDRNVQLETEDFHISYNSGDNTPDVFAGDTNNGETAIVVGNQYFILNGDFREEYEALIDKGLDVCINFFLSHEDKISSWSNYPDKQKGLTS